jgi:hypothetical protein
LFFVNFALDRYIIHQFSNVNANEGKEIPVIYGCVTSGKLWQFLKLEGKNVTIDVNEYQVIPVDRILGILKWMLEN